MTTRGRGVRRVEIELTPDVEPISGRVKIDGQAERPFAGMLELMTMLDEARTPNTDADPTVVGGQEDVTVTG